MDVTLAYHCKSQETLLNVVIPSPSIVTWEDLTRYAIPLWIKDLKKLRELIDVVAITEFKRSKEKDAEKVGSVALYYILLNKKNILMNLYLKSGKGQKVQEFLAHDFNEDRWKKAAVRNAYQLFSQKKFLTAAAFYLLGGQLNEATQVAITHLKDLQLAVTICRLIEGDNSSELKRIYKEYYIDKGTSYNDPWITSLGYWINGEYIKSLNSIKESIEREESKPNDMLHQE